MTTTVPRFHDTAAVRLRTAAGRFLRRWAMVVAIAALVGAGIAAFSSKAGYDERLIDLAARQALAPDAYRESSDSPVLQGVLLDVASDPELTFKMRLALSKLGATARQVLETFGAERALHELLRRFGEQVVPVVAYFMDNDIATLRASYALSRMGQAIKARANSVFGDSGSTEETAAATPAEYSPAARGHWAIAQIGTSGHQFLAQFAIDAQGVAHWNQTDRVLKSVEDFLLGGIRDLETRHDVGAPIGIGDVASAGVDVLTVFGFAKVLKFFRASRASGKAAQWASLSERRALLGQRVLLTGGKVGKSALKLGAAAGAVYLVLRHPGLLTGLFVEAGSWLGVPAWAAAAAGWWAVALFASFLLLPLLACITVLNPILARIARTARWLMGSNRPQQAPAKTSS